MFIKLVKYDLKHIFKSVGVFMLILLACAILQNLTSYDTTYEIVDDVTQATIHATPIQQFIHAIFYNGVYGFLIALILNAYMRIWHRFRTNFYGDEAYLTHTLPVSRSTLWAAKFISAFLTVISVILCIGLTFGILNLTEYGRQLINSFGFTNDIPTSFSLTLIATIATQTFFIAICGLTGLVIGHRASNHRMLWSVISGFAIYYCCALLLLGFIGILALINPDFAYLFKDSDNPNAIFGANFVTNILLAVGAIYLALTASLYFIDNKLLQRGINLD